MARRRRSSRQRLSRPRRRTRFRRAVRRRAGIGGISGGIIKAVNALWGINNIAGAEIAAAPDLGSKFTWALNTIVGRVSGINFIPDAPQVQRTLNLGGIFNGQTITGIIMLAYSRFGRNFKLPMTGKAGSFGRQAITWGVGTGLFSANPTPFSMNDQTQGIVIGQ